MPNNTPLWQHTTSYLSVNRNVDDSYFLAILHNAVMKIPARVFARTCFYFSWLHVEVKLLSHIIAFWILLNCFPEWFHNYTIQTIWSVSFYHIVTTLAIIGMKLCLIVVLICISLMHNDVELLFMYSLVVCISDLEKYSIIS